MRRPYTAAMGCLVDLEEVEALPLIRRAFELGRIDETVRGSWGDVLDEMGIEPADNVPLLRESQRRFEERREKLLPSQQRRELQEALARVTGRDPEDLFGDRPASKLRSPQQALLPTGELKKRKQNTAEAKARKQKNKRKAEAASRKANRKKRK